VLKAYGQKTPLVERFLNKEPAQTDHRWAEHNEWDIGRSFSSPSIWLFSPQRSGSPISRYRQLYTHGLCFQGLRLTAGTVERQTSWDMTRYASGEHPGPWHGMNRLNARLGPPPAALEGVQVQLEPLLTVTQRRNEIRITGSASSGLSSEDIDIAIVSLDSQDSQTATLPLVATEDDSIAERTAKLVEKHLNAVAGEKRGRHPPSDRPFRPFFLSLGGMMEKDAKDALKLWKSIMTGGVYSLLVARARCFEP
jgi:hypothetical protein